LVGDPLSAGGKIGWSLLPGKGHARWGMGGGGFFVFLSGWGNGGRPVIRFLQGIRIWGRFQQ